MAIFGIDFGSIGDWTAADWAENALKAGVSIYSLAQAGGVDVPTDAEFLAQINELYSDPQFRASAKANAQWQSEVGDTIQLGSNRRMLQGGMESVMGSDYDPNASIAGNIINADRMYNPELYGARDAIMGKEYQGLGRVGTYFGEAAQAGSRVGNALESRALSMLGTDQLTAREQRDVNEMARAGFNDRGRVRDTASVVREIMDNENARRARRTEARAFATDAANVLNPLTLANQSATNQMTQFNAGQATNADLNNVRLDQADFENSRMVDLDRFNAAQSTRVDPLSNAGVYTQNPNATNGLLTVGNVGSTAASLTGARIAAEDEAAGRRANILWGAMGPYPQG